jgi:serine protease AprX
MDKLRSARCFNTQLLLLFIFSCAAFGGTLGPELKKIPSARNIQVIVQYTKGSGGTGLESSLSAGAKKVADLPNGALYSMTAGEAASIASHPSVANVSSAARPIHSTGAPVFDFMPQAISAPSPHLPFNYASGNGIGVVVVDSGINVNDDLRGTVIYSENFSSDSDMVDHFGHGTHVAGLIAGNGNNSLLGYAHNIHGVAPGVHFINLKVLNKDGASTDGEVIQAITRAVELKKQHPEWNIKVMNLSLGRPIYEASWQDPLCLAVENAWLNGITVVVAAGNDGRLNSAGTHGYGTIASPANDPLAITVGSLNTESSATHSDDLMTSYSSKGPTLIEHTVKPDLVAPGNKLFSVLAAGSTLAGMPGAVLVPAPIGSPNYMELSGTSMAAAVTSGAVAAVLANENLTPDQVKARLMKTADKLSRKTYTISVIDPTTMAPTLFTVQNDIFTVGAGNLDLGAALNAKGDPKFTIPANENAASPVAVPQFNKDGRTVTVNLQNYLGVYGKDVFTVWGSDAFTVWGSDAFTVWGSDTFTVWGSDAFTVWGSFSVWGSSMFGPVTGSDAFTVWGSDTFTVWGSDAFTVWGSSAVWGSATPGQPAGAFNSVWSSDAFTVWGSAGQWANASDASTLAGDSDAGEKQ